MKVHAQPEQGKVVVSSVCEACGNGCHDILRPCAGCGRTLAEKAALRGDLYGADPAAESLVFFKPGRVS